MLFDRIFSSDNLQQALDFLLTKNDSSGIDGMPLSQLSEYWEMNRDLLIASIKDGTYEPQTVILFELLGKNGKRRRLSKFASVDRLILRAIYQILYEVLTPTFSGRSFAFKKNSGTMDAVKLASDYVSGGKTWLVELDIRKYFDQIPHAQLLTMLSPVLNDEQLVELLGKYLHCRVMEDEQIWNNSRGVLQGNPISPLFGNFYLTPLDHYCDERQYSYVRYADDIKLFAASYEEGARLLKEIADFVTESLKLPVAPEKCGVYPVYGRVILGYQLFAVPAGIEIRRCSRTQKGTTSYWKSSAIEKREDAYHIIGNGILTKKDYSLLFENEQIKTDLPPEAVHSLNIHSDVVFSSYFF